jgi:hypothetical protein
MQRKLQGKIHCETLKISTSLDVGEKKGKEKTIENSIN